MAEVDPEEIRWLWYPRIARGKVTMLDGDPGAGKSFVSPSEHATRARLMHEYERTMRGHDVSDLLAAQ